MKCNNFPLNNGKIDQKQVNKLLMLLTNIFLVSCNSN